MGEAGDKKGKAPKKRDPNKPLAKPKKKGKVLRLLVGAVAALLLVWMGLYSVELGRGPWAWGGEDWSGFVTFSRQQIDEARAMAGNVDWAAIKDQITEKTRGLYDQASTWEDKLDRKLAELGGGDAAAGDAGDAGDAAPAAAGEPAAVAASLPAYQVRYREGCETFREAIRHYKRSVPGAASEAQQQRELRTAKGLFHEAREHLEAAYQGAEAAGDGPTAGEIEEVLMQCGQYLEDCSKRETL